ncbi:MAG: hypothetical protein Q8P27_02380 [Candidatus Peregrinibacteria bacterium]|nr:hypothetical protein [Candidatus Peregrinibacteria bacterium]
MQNEPSNPGSLPQGNSLAEIPKLVKPANEGVVPTHIELTRTLGIFTHFLRNSLSTKFLKLTGGPEKDLVVQKVNRILHKTMQSELSRLSRYLEGLRDILDSIIEEYPLGLTVLIRCDDEIGRLLDLIHPIEDVTPDDFTTIYDSTMALAQDLNSWLVAAVGSLREFTPEDEITVINRWISSAVQADADEVSTSLSNAA